MAEPEVILIAAPDTSFRHSLEFALESDGFRVYAHSYASDALTSVDARRAACAVLDDDAIGDWEQTREQLNSFAKPVILLVGLFHTTPDLPFVKPVMKPFLGEPLIEAVRRAVAGLV